MLFKKKKKDEQATEEVSKVIEYSPEELQLINNLVEDFVKPPGHVEIPPEETETADEGIQEEEKPEIDPEIDIESTPSFAKPKIETKTNDDLGEFDDLADLDLDSLEKVEPAEETRLEESGDQTPAPADDFAMDDLVADTPAPTDDFAMDDLAADTPAPTDDFAMDDLVAETPAPADDFAMDDLVADTPAPTDDFAMDDLAADTPAPADDFAMDDLAADTPAPTDDFAMDDLVADSPPPADDFAMDDLGAETPTPADDFALDDLAADTPAPTDDFAMDDLVADTPPPADDFAMDDLVADTPAPADDFAMDDLAADTPAPADDFAMDDLAADTPAPTDDFGLDNLGAQTPQANDFTFDDMSPPSLDDVSPEVVRGSAFGGLDDELNELADEQKDKEISDEQLNSLRKTIKSFSPSIRQSVIDTLLGNKLGKTDSSELIKKLVLGTGEDEIKSFLEKKLGKKFDKKHAKEESDRKVIVSRAQYTEKGLESRRKIIGFTKFAIVAIPLLLVISSSIYLFGIKKYLYHHDIENGKEIILSQSFTSSDISKAEKYFTKAIERYPENSEAYLQFADAYRRQGLYENAFEKLFGKVTINPAKKAIRIENQEINQSEDIWSLIKKVPIIRYKNNDKKTLYINDIPFNLQKRGAYILTHLDKKQDEAIVLYALGNFHSSPTRKFARSVYRNNRLGIDYYNRILNFKSTTPLFQRDKFISTAILGIGNIYYNNNDYNKAHDYFEKIIRKNPYDVEGQTGIMKTLIKMYESPMYQTSSDPRLIIQQHSLIKHTYKIENKLPLFMLAKLASFYIDLPDKDDLRIEYNTSPIDKVNNKSLKSRAEELLNIMYNKTDEDIYGNKISGKTFAEGYYQRGRYFRKVVKQYRMAMTQFEYAFKYDPNHFMALNDRAEILMELNDYDGAKKHLTLAEEKITDSFLDNLGDRPEDETLLEADRGIVTFNLAKILYLSQVKSLDKSHDWLRIQETDKFESSGEYGKEALITMLDQVDMYLDKAEGEGLKSDIAKSELSYYRGWINYVKSDYARALFYWQSISPSWDNKMPNLELAKSYALYYMGTRNINDQRRYMETSLSHLYYLQGKYTPLAESVSNPSESNKNHETIFSKMAIIENNMGAIFEIMGEEDNALKHYQKSIEYSKKINQENEIAHLNIRLSFKRSDLDIHEKYPLIMDFISPYLKDNVL